ncbi:MAG: HlyD family secretion protein [Chlamydiota bacterium]
MEEKHSKVQSFKLPFFLTITILLIILGFIFSGIYFYLTKNYAWTNDANIEAYRTDLSSNVTEKVIAIYFDEGDRVKKGDLIALLENDVPKAELATAKAKIASLKEEIAVKEAYFLKVRNDFIRAEEGIQDAVISAQQFDHKQKDLEIAEAELSLAYANLELSKKELEIINTELTHYEIRAPNDGVIVKRWIWLGDVISPGQATFTMYDLNNIWVLANLEEGKMEKVKLGSQVDIHVDAYPGYIFHGEVFTIKGAAASQFTLVPQNNATGNYTKVSQRVPIKISIHPPNDFPEELPLYLFPGLSAEVWIKVQ